MILLIDNYDSFTYNLLHYLGELDAKTIVKRNDKITIKEIEDDNSIKAIVVSPGPCTPKEAGISVDVIKYFYNKMPILGVCLGHQSIGEAFGGKIIRAADPVHGKTSQIFHENKGIFKNIPNPFIATRYHSLIIQKASIPDCLNVTAKTEDGTIMALEHKEYPVFGVQFHPESIASEYGHKILQNFINVIKND